MGFRLYRRTVRNLHASNDYRRLRGEASRESVQRCKVKVVLAFQIGYRLSVLRGSPVLSRYAFVMQWTPALQEDPGQSPPLGWIFAAFMARPTPERQPL